MLDPKLKLVLCLTKKDGTTRWYRAMSFSRFIHLNSLSSFIKAYVKVVYPLRKCSKGCVCEFANWGTYDNKKDLVFAVKAFLEK